MKVLYYVICANMITYKNNDILYENYMIIQNDLNNICHETNQILSNIHDIHWLKLSEYTLDK